jgi:hypothetical protein
MQEARTHVQRLSYTTEILHLRSKSRSRTTKTERKEGERRTFFLRLTLKTNQRLLNGGQAKDP